MIIGLTQKQLDLILSNSELRERDAPTVDATPKSGASGAQSGGRGYPQVGKWESGVTRGPANQVGNTKWSDIVGSVLKRGKANPLKEQSFADARIDAALYRSSREPERFPYKEWLDNQTWSRFQSNVAKIQDDYPLLLPIIASVAAGIVTGGSSLLVQAIAQVIVQAPFSVYEYKKGDNFGATLGLILAAIPFSSYLRSTYGGALKSLSNGGDDFIKKLLMLKNRERILKYLQTLKPNSPEAILLSKLMKQTPNEFAKAMGEGIIYNLNWLVKNNKIQLSRIPLKMRHQIAELILALGIAVPPSIYMLVDEYKKQGQMSQSIDQSIYDEIKITPEQQKALDNWKPQKKQ